MASAKDGLFKNQRCLVIAPHPDDETIVGGLALLIRHIRGE